MAHRDQSAGFSFMYVDIAKLLTQKQEIAKNEEAPVLTRNVPTVNLSKDPKPAPAAPVKEEVESSARVVALPFLKEREAAIHQIKDNLDRLQALHHKLHAMLEDLNKLTDKKTQK